MWQGGRGGGGGRARREVGKGKGAGAKGFAEREISGPRAETFVFLESPNP